METAMQTPGFKPLRLKTFAEYTAFGKPEQAGSKITAPVLQCLEQH
jgi:hypothetical protein